jgi:hypothetical protein
MRRAHNSAVLKMITSPYLLTSKERVAGIPVFPPRVWKGGALQAAEKPVGFPCPVRAQDNSRGQRPRKA